MDKTDTDWQALYLELLAQRNEMRAILENIMTHPTTFNFEPIREILAKSGN